MDYEQKYNEALEHARAEILANPGLRKTWEEIFPELRESEDERIRKLLVWQVHRNIEDETNDLAQSVYDGIKGHDPDIEESIEDWKRCLAYLEKQKEQKPAEWSEEDEIMLGHIQYALSYANCNRVIDETTKEYVDNWLKSLRPQPKAELSEDVKKTLDEVSHILIGLNYKQVAKDYKQAIEKLLYSRPSWKPSEEDEEPLSTF